MVDRPLESLTLIFGTLVLPFLLSAASNPAGSPRNLPAAGASVAQVEPEVHIQWVLRSRDLATCVTAAPNLRRALFDHGSRVRIVAFAVEADTAVVRSYLRRERLFRIEVRRITEREFQREFAHRAPEPVATPMLIMVPPGAAADDVFASGNNRLPGDRQGSAELLARLEAFFRSSAAPHRALHPSITTGGGEK